jgi:hypothetical protein
MATTKYSQMELRIIRDCRKMGYTDRQIAEFLNRKEHNGNKVRSYDGVRKIR